jgi:hypothetical protein
VQQNTKLKNLAKQKKNHKNKNKIRYEKNDQELNHKKSYTIKIISDDINRT